MLSGQTFLLNHIFAIYACFSSRPVARFSATARASAHLQSVHHAPTHAKSIRPVFHSGHTFPSNHSFAIYASLSSRTVALFSATASASAHLQSTRHYRAADECTFPLPHITPPFLPIGGQRIPPRPLPRLTYLAAARAPRCISVRYRWYRRGMKASRRRGFLRASMQMAS